MKHPLVSCIIPVYNGARYLEESIDSVLGQSYQPLELIVVDDGSTDATAKVAARYGKRLRYVSQPHGGAPTARNHGVKLAQGDFIAFQDADDIWHVEKLARQMARFIARPELDLCVTHIKNFWIAELHAEAQHFHNHRLARAVPGYVMQSLLVRRALFDRIGLLNNAWGHAAERDFFMRAAEHEAVFELLPEVLVSRRLHHSNFSRHVSASLADHLRVIKASLDRRRQGVTAIKPYEFPGANANLQGKETASAVNRLTTGDKDETKDCS